MDEDLDTCLDCTSLRFIRFKARQLAGRYGFRHDEIEDVGQALIVECLERQRNFDPHRASRRTFTRLVVNRGIANMVASQKTRSRDYRLRRESLHSFGKRVECISATHLVDGETGPLELRHDIRHVLAQLDPTDRLVGVALMHYSPMEASRKLRLARSTIYQHIRRLRTAFAAAGLGRHREAQWYRPEARP